MYYIKMLPSPFEDLGEDICWAEYPILLMVVSIRCNFKQGSTHYEWNINTCEAAKLLEERSYLTCDTCSRSEGSIGRDHFRNHCLSHFGKFSWAVDCFLELCYAVFKSHLQNITRNAFLTLSLSHVIQGKTLALLKVCDSLCGHIPANSHACGLKLRCHAGSRLRANFSRLIEKCELLSSCLTQFPKIC